MRVLQRAVLLSAVVAVASMATGCAEAPEGEGRPDRPSPAEPPVILFLGTSLTAGYGVLPGSAYPALIEERLRREGLRHEVVNAGQSGETSDGALDRLPWLLDQRFDVLVLETGANDMLQGRDPASARANIQAIIDGVRKERPEATIVLVGMTAPTGFETAYTRRFERIYPALARRNRLPLVPSLLDGVAGVPAHNLGDGIHPNEEGHRRMADTVWEVLRPLL